MAPIMKSVDELIAKMEREHTASPIAGAYSSPHGDCVYFWNESAPCHRDRVDGLLTVYRADGDGRIIGVQVKGISRLPEHDVISVEVRERGGISMVTLILMTMRARPLVGGNVRGRSAAGRAQTSPAPYLDAMRAVAGGWVDAEDLKQLLSTTS